MTDAPDRKRRVDQIAFTLPFATESLNVTLTKHWARRSGDKRDMAQEVMVAIGGPRHYPRPPWRHVAVSICRYSRGTLDQDNLYASVKPILDALCASSATHPHGLGIIEDDRPDLLTLEVTQAKAAKGRTEVLIMRRNA